MSSAVITRMYSKGSRPIGLPNLLQHLDQALPVVRRPRLGLVVDFDGTISEIAPTPDEATISPGCAESLKGLSRKLALVSVVSGRSAAAVSAKVGLDGVTYVGNHGAEYLAGGRLSVAPGAEEYRGRIIAVLDHLRANVDISGLLWQDKGLGASVHYRRAPDANHARRTLVAALKSAPAVEELEVFWGKLVLELRPPTGLNKGYALSKLVHDRELDGVIFMGDDTTDVDALVALRELVAQEVLAGLGVAVMHDDSPEALSEAADYGLNGVPEVEAFLSWLETVTG